MTTQFRQAPTYDSPLIRENQTNSVWYRYLQANETGVPPSGESAVTVTASPFTYTAPRKGFLIVSGGTVSAIAFARLGPFYGTGQTTGTFTLALNDQLKITYSGKPTVTFVPT